MSARPDPCGGRPVTGVPIATFLPRQFHIESHWLVLGDLARRKKQVSDLAGLRPFCDTEVPDGQPPQCGKAILPLLRMPRVH
jgi:hypothetical protein